MYTCTVLCMIRSGITYFPVKLLIVYRQFLWMVFQSPQLRDIGRKYRQYHEAGKKELEESKAENEELKKKLEESQVAFAEASSAPPPLPAEDLDKIKVGILNLNYAIVSL